MKAMFIKAFNYNDILFDQFLFFYIILPLQCITMYWLRLFQAKSSTFIELLDY